MTPALRERIRLLLERLAVAGHDPISDNECCAECGALLDHRATCEIAAVLARLAEPDPPPPNPTEAPLPCPHGNPPGACFHCETAGATPYRFWRPWP